MSEETFPQTPVQLEHASKMEAATEGSEPSGAGREALDAVDAGAIAWSHESGWGVWSPAWWDGFSAADLDAALTGKLVRIIPSKRHNQTVKLTALGRYALSKASQ